MKDNTYIVCGCKPWCRKVFRDMISGFSGKWWYCADKTSLEIVLTDTKPRYIFFLHWNWKVPPEITDNYECINFHMTSLPYGRGGSPLQNLIVGMVYATEVTAHRMTQEIDGGHILSQRPMLLHGTAEEMYLQANYLMAAMIDEIIHGKFIERPQAGKPVYFNRRTPEQSELPENMTLPRAYDYIRMLDAETYPKAFIQLGNLRLEFSHACRYTDRVEAHVTITEKP